MTTARTSGLFTLVFGIAVFSPSLAAANPNLTMGVWQDITPPVVTKGAPETCIGQGVAIDLKNRSTIYWGTTPYTDSAGGLFKSTDAGSTWQKVAKVQPGSGGGSDHLDMPLHIRIDPNDSNHIYANDGVRGGSQGFYVSNDGAATFVKPQGFIDALKAASINTQDTYDVAADPTDFKHLLVSFHSAWGWTDSKWNTNAGVLESKDGGTTWIVHEPMPGWGAGHSIKFLYDPARNVGNSQTWLLGTQGDGFWRTTDGGAHWTKVTDTTITHGGGTIYYAGSGLLYASGANALRSKDNGATWSSLSPQAAWCVYGDGKTLYTGKSFGANQPMMTSPETDGTTWTAFNTQIFSDGPYEMAYDAVNGIMYSSNWSLGVWALKVGPGDPDAGVSIGGGGPSGGKDAGASNGAGGATVTGGSTGTGGTNASGVGGSDGAMQGMAGNATTPAPQGSGSSGSTSAGSGGTSMNDNALDEPAGSQAEAGCACRVSTTRGAQHGPVRLLALSLGLALAFARRWRSTQRASGAKD